MRTSPLTFASPAPFVLPEHWPELAAFSAAPMGDYGCQLAALDVIAASTSTGTAVVGGVTPETLSDYADSRDAEPNTVLVDFLEEVAPLAVHRPMCGALTAVQVRTQLALSRQRANVQPGHLDAAEAQASGVIDDLTSFAVRGPASIEVHFHADMPSESVLFDLGRGRAVGTLGATADALHTLAFYAGVVGGSIMATRATGEVWAREMTLVGGPVAV
jgi:hypothetical protein